MTWTRAGVLMGLLLSRAVPMQSDVQRGIATAGAAQDMGARCTAAAEMFPQHTKISAPGPLSPVVADGPGPVSLASAGGPGHSTSVAHGAAVGPDPATPRPGSGHSTSPAAAADSQRRPAGLAGELVGAPEQIPGRSADQTTSSLLYEAAGALRCLTERHERVPSLIDELRDRAACFAAHGD